tara:strand:+ start:1558 stop:2124 length:567 start_codon:yes stop_codon:yes gene_type:complete
VAQVVDVIDCVLLTGNGRRLSNKRYDDKSVHEHVRISNMNKTVSTKTLVWSWCESKAHYRPTIPLNAPHGRNEEVGIFCYSRPTFDFSIYHQIALVFCRTELGNVTVDSPATMHGIGNISWIGTDCFASGHCRWILTRVTRWGREQHWFGSALSFALSLVGALLGSRCPPEVFNAVVVWILIQMIHGM